MARITCLCNQKGGVGKTTSSVNLGAYLAALGKRTLLVDLDSQANASSGIGISADENQRTIYEALMGDASLETIIRPTKIFGYDIAAASSNLAGATVELVNLPDREYRLKNILNSVREKYDYIIIDPPPSLGLLTINGMVACQDIIIPVQCEYYSLEGLSQLLKTISLVKEHLSPGLDIKGALLTMYDRRNRLSREVSKEVRRNFPGYVFETVIPRNISLAEAPSFGQSILQFDPHSKGASAYRQFAQELINLENNINNNL